MNETWAVILGIFLTLGMHIAAIIICATLASLLPGEAVANIFVYSLAGIGIAQLFYVIPVIILLSRRRQWGLMKGVIIGAVITTLLNGGCWLLIASISR